MGCCVEEICYYRIFSVSSVVQAVFCTFFLSLLLMGKRVAIFGTRCPFVMSSTTCEEFGERAPSGDTFKGLQPADVVDIDLNHVVHCEFVARSQDVTNLSTTTLTNTY